MSEPKLISPLLDGYVIGSAISDHNGVRCYPAMKENSDNKYIVKIISIPASQVQLDALLLAGAYKDPAGAMDYFKALSDGVVKEADYLQKISKLDGFLPYDGWQVVPMEQNALGYQVYLVSSYKRSLEKHMRRSLMTHLEAVNLGLDLCAALAVSRRAGCLYVDLKPSNIFISEDKEYRIGDLGFVEMESLKFTSMPSKYRSPYAPPETLDDMSTLNDTVDIYELGMILYQIYNDGKLPDKPKEPDEPFPSPANADYEIAEIIMKACAPDSKERWKDPTEMGQALVAYMQRNSINDTPISPPSAVFTNPVITPVLSGTDDTAPTEADAEGLKDEQMTRETSNIVAQADDLLAHKTPEGVVAPEPIEVPVPDPITPVDEEDDEEVKDAEGTEEAVADLPEEDGVNSEEPVVRKHRSRSWIALVILVLLLALAGFGGFYFYQNYYLQNINSIHIDGSQNELIVTVDTEVDNALLTVTCTDTYGNTMQKPIVNGQAVFTDLSPDSLYKIQLEIDGFHKLVGQISDIFTTEATTNIVSFTAITGPEDGSVLLTLTVDGPEPEKWVVTYSTDGEEALSQSFSGHSVTINNLTVDKLYYFHLTPDEEMYIDGQTTLSFTASKLIMAENLSIDSIAGGVLTVSWDAPADTNVVGWNVRCYSDDGFEVLDSVSETGTVFTGIDPTKAYTVEVTAAGMTQPSRTSITANPITITSFDVDEEDPEKLSVSWDYEGAAPEGGWLLMYSMDNNETPNIIKCEDALGVIAPRIPGASYEFSIQAADSTSIFGNTRSYNCPNAEIFFENALSAEKITSHLLRTPEKENWSYMDVGKNDYTDTFSPGEKISLLLHASVNFYLNEQDISILYVIRDGAGNVIADLISQDTGDWYTMWVNQDYHYCELDIPQVPLDAGNYSVSVYFNGAAITSATFTIAE